MTGSLVERARRAAADYEAATNRGLRDKRDKRDKSSGLSRQRGDEINEKSQTASPLSRLSRLSRSPGECEGVDADELRRCYEQHLAFGMIDPRNRGREISEKSEESPPRPSSDLGEISEKSEKTLPVADPLSRLSRLSGSLSACEEPQKVDDNDRARAEAAAWNLAAVRWYSRFGKRLAIEPTACAGCGEVLAEAGHTLEMLHGERVHAADGYDCVLLYGQRWKRHAGAALAAIGIAMPTAIAAAIENPLAIEDDDNEPVLQWPVIRRR